MITFVQSIFNIVRLTRSASKITGHYIPNVNNYPTRSKLEINFRWNMTHVALLRFPASFYNSLRNTSLIIWYTNKNNHTNLSRPFHTQKRIRNCMTSWYYQNLSIINIAMLLASIISSILLSKNTFSNFSNSEILL